jgi:hypothetical protein
MSKKIFKQAFIPQAFELAAPFVEAYLAEQGVNATGDMVKGLIGKLKGVAGDVESQSKDPSQKSSELRRELVFKELANAFRALGVGAPYNNAEQLFALFGNQMPGAFTDKESYLQVIEALKEFLESSASIINRDPSLATDAVKYMFKLLTSSAFDVEYTSKKLNELAQKATDPFSDGYVISILKGNFALAGTFLLMQSLTEKGRFDSTVFSEMKNLTSQANKILGPASAELTNAIALQTAIGRSNFEQISKDRNAYQASIPVAIEAQQVRSNIMKYFGDFYNSPAFVSILNEPIVKLLIMGASGFKAGIQGISSPGFGEAFSQNR